MVGLIAFYGNCPGYLTGEFTKNTSLIAQDEYICCQMLKAMSKKGMGDHSYKRVSTRFFNSTLRM